MRALTAHLLRIAASLAVAIPTLGCTPARLLNAVITENGYKIEHDIAYAGDERHHLDIYIPDKLSPNRPVAVFFYGGRWEYGSKADYLFVGQALASKGIMTVIADYRLYPDVRFPAFIEDGAKAVSWVHGHIGQHGGNADQIFLVGHSAGAHIAAMLALNPDFLAAEGVDIGAIKGMIGLAGPYDFLPIQDQVVKEVFAVKDLEATQPITHASASAPKTLLLTGDDDATVYPRNSLGLQEAIRLAGGDADIKIYENTGHVGIILALASPFRWLTPTLEDISSFIKKASFSSSRKAA